MNFSAYYTPEKYGQAVLEGSGAEGEFDCRAVDCPTLFRHNGRYYMMYIGFDGRGYQTGLAVSDDLLHWEKLGCILKRGSGMEWDKVGQAGVWILRDPNLYGSYEPYKYKGRYWLFYHSYPSEGYESGPAKIGLAWCEDESLTDWHMYGEPVFSFGEAGQWDGGGLYKCSVAEYDGIFYMYYNAKDENGTEQTGIATSPDLLSWTRYEGNPILRVEARRWDSRFCSDPHIAYDEREKRWVLFYYGFDGSYAQDGIAVSDDMLNWTKCPEPILRVGADGEIDSRYAHKPSVIYADGKLWHFYCACRPHHDGDKAKNGGENRCISVRFN